MIHVTLQLLLITLVIVLVIRQAWVLIFMNHMLVQWFLLQFWLSAHRWHPEYILFPLVLAGIGLVSSIVGLLFNLVLRCEPAAMLRNATYIAIVAFLAATYLYQVYMIWH